MGRLATDVEDLENELEELRGQLEELATDNRRLTDDLHDTLASLTGATREIEELYEYLEYFKKVHPETDTAWRVTKRMEEA